MVLRFFEDSQRLRKKESPMSERGRSACLSSYDTEKREDKRPDCELREKL